MTAAVAIPVRPGSPEWLEARYDGIGASEAAAALGLSRYQSKVGLWAQKLRLVPPPDPTPEMRMGLLTEPINAGLYEESEGLAPGTLRRVGFLQRHPVNEWMLATVDRRRPKRRLVELKWSERAEGYGEPGTDEVPDEVLAQVLHQLIVTNYVSADVSLLHGARIRVYHIERDADAEALIVERERELWSHVASRTEPPIDGSEATARYLAARYPRDNGLAIEADELAEAALRDALAVRAEIKAAEARKTAADNVLQALMGEATRLNARGLGYVLWRQSKDRELIHWEQIAAAYRKAIERELELVERGDMVTTALPSIDELDAIASLYTETKSGSRPFLPKPEKGDPE